MRNDNPVVLYHGECADGFTAAWLARDGLKGREPFFFPVQYGEQPPREAFSGHAVYVLDFSFDGPTVEKMIEMSSTFVLLDHHKTAGEALQPLIEKYKGVERVKIVFDMAKSGARLAWEHFHTREPDAAPRLVRYVEDRDLWKWALPDSRAVSAWLASFPKTFAQWDQCAKQLEPGSGFIEPGGYESAVDGGEAILRYQERVVANHVKHAYEVTIQGHKVACCNCTTLTSEVGAALADGAPFGATFFIKPDGSKVYSLRSRPPAGIDVSKIAKACSPGGGGHPGAAGFTLPPGKELNDV